MSINSFEDLVCWKKSKDLTVDIYKESRDIRDNPFNSQIKRASVSIMNNIAEGFERSTNKEFKYFLFVAKGSCGEVRSMLQLASDLDYISETKTTRLINDSVEISKTISGLIKRL